MFKKIISLILMIVLFMTASCSSKEPDIVDGDDQPGTKETTKEIAWPLADGIWICEYEGAFEFIYMSVSDGLNCFTDGVLFSGLMDGGPISDLVETEKNVYEFTVNVPSVPANDMDSGHDEFSVQVRCDTSRLDEKILSIAFNGNEARDFTYIAESLEDIDISDVYGG